MNGKVEPGTGRVSRNSALEEGGRPSSQRAFFSLRAHSRAGAGQPGARGGCFKGNEPMIGRSGGGGGCKAGGESRVGRGEQLTSETDLGSEGREGATLEVRADQGQP